MSNLAAAIFSPSFDLEFSLLDSGLQSWLRTHGLNQASRLACPVPKMLAGESFSERLMVLLDGMPTGSGGYPSFFLYCKGQEEWRRTLQHARAA